MAILVFGWVGRGLIIPDFLATLDEAVTGAGCGVVFSIATSTGCNANTAKGSGRPLATVLDQFSASVGGINPAATSGETGLIEAAPGVVAGVAGVGTAAVLVGAAGAPGAGVGLVAAVGAGAGAAGFLSPSPPQLEVRIAKLLIILR